MRRSEKEKQEIVRKNNEEKRELTEQIRKQLEDIKELRIENDISKKRAEVLDKERITAEKLVKDLDSKIRRQEEISSVGADVRQIMELEHKNREYRKEIAGLNLIAENVQKTAEENKILKTKLEELMKDKLEVEESIEACHRRVSKSFDEEIIVDGNVTEEMIVSEANASNAESSGTDAVHGFEGYPSPVGSDVIDGKDIGEKIGLKRNNTSPSNGQKVKRKHHPRVGSSILVDTVEGTEVYQVVSKKNEADNDYVYCLSKNGKQSTLNLKRVKWHIFDSGEKIPLKTNSLTN